MQEQRPANLEIQIKVSKILARGFIFSIVWLGGIGSLIALISGLKARAIISRSEGELVGMKMAWWCIIVGAIGIVVSPFVIISGLMPQSK